MTEQDELAELIKQEWENPHSQIFRETGSWQALAAQVSYDFYSERIDTEKHHHNDLDAEAWHVRCLEAEQRISELEVEVKEQFESIMGLGNLVKSYEAARANEKLGEAEQRISELKEHLDSSWVLTPNRQQELLEIDSKQRKRISALESALEEIMALNPSWFYDTLDSPAVSKDDLDELITIARKALSKTSEEDKEGEGE